MTTHNWSRATQLAKHSLSVGFATQLFTESGEAREMASMLRFVDMWNHLEPRNSHLLHTVRWYHDHLTIHLWNTGDSGLPVEPDDAERWGSRMAKILWNLGAPPVVFLTGEEAAYELRWENPAVVGEAA